MYFNVFTDAPEEEPVRLEMHRAFSSIQVTSVLILNICITCTDILVLYFKYHLCFMLFASIH